MQSCVVVLGIALLGSFAYADESPLTHSMVVCSLQSAKRENAKTHAREYLAYFYAGRIIAAPIDAAKVLNDAIKHFRAQAAAEHVALVSCAHVKQYLRCVGNANDESCPDAISDDGMATQRASIVLDDYWSSLGDSDGGR